MKTSEYLNSEHVDQWASDWNDYAACANANPESFFVQGAAQKQAARICFTCPVRLRCLSIALDNRLNFGVWGGMTERERRALLREYPAITNWAKAIRGDKISLPGISKF